LFCIPKAAVLHGKSVGFAAQNSRFRNAKSKLLFFKEIIFTKLMLLSSSMLGFLETSIFFLEILDSPAISSLLVNAPKHAQTLFFAISERPPTLQKPFLQPFHTQLLENKKSWNTSRPSSFSNLLSNMFPFYKSLTKKEV